MCSFTSKIYGACTIVSHVLVVMGNIQNERIIEKELIQNPP